MFLSLTVVSSAVILISFRAEYILQQARQKAEHCLSAAVDLHHEKIFEQNPGSLTYIYSPQKDSLVTLGLDKRKIKLSVRSDAHSVIKMAQQTFLHDEQAIEYAMLDSLFKTALQKEQMPQETSILVYYQGFNKRIAYPTRTRKAAFTVKTKALLLGTSKELSITAEMKIRPGIFLKWILTDFVTLVILGSCSAALAALYLLPAWPLPQLASQPGTTDDRAPTFQYASIRINMEDHSVYIGTTRVDTGPRNFTLLLMFLAAEKQFVSREQIINTFWSSKIDCSDRLNTTINRLRSYLRKEDPSLYIITEDEGYQLVSADDPALSRDMKKGSSDVAQPIA